MHWFCPNDLNHYVGWTMWKYVVVRPLVAIVWPIQEGADLIQKEVTTLEEARFSFDHSCVQRLFGSQSFSSSISHVLVMNVHNILRSTNASCWPIICDGKKVRWPSVFKITQHTNNWEVGILLTQCTIFPAIDVLSPRYGRIYNILANDKGYFVTIGNFLRCSCVYFVIMLVGFLGSREVYV
jgi:hypothetical protein